ncbi:ig-like domain-containing protein [Trichonephila clavipes]|nr:ig-like domain-containing protein [Trichonephila clavipes]
MWVQDAIRQAEGKEALSQACTFGEDTNVRNQSYFPARPNFLESDWVWNGVKRRSRKRSTWGANSTLQVDHGSYTESAYLENYYQQLITSQLSTSIPLYRQTETVFTNGSLSELLIESVDRGDSALFTCLARNSYGKDETNIQLIIQGRYNYDT